MLQPIIIKTNSFNPYKNLAMEEYLQKALKENQIALYLWQNADTVVIGRTQNPWRECRLECMEKNGVLLARRTTGGGAVFHDRENLNFSFIVPKQHYDYERQCQVVLEAVNMFGIHGERSGRNDFVADGRKFSGNAFSRLYDNYLHHGTLLIHTNVEKMRESLQVSAEKMKAKGVKSVVSRVVNLRELSPKITIEGLQDAMCVSFEKMYGSAEIWENILEEEEEVCRIAGRNASDEWLFGNYHEFESVLEHKFSWGELQIHLDTVNGTVVDVKVYSDALHSEFIMQLEQILIGLPSDLRRISEVVSAADWIEETEAMAQEIAAWIVSAEPL